MTHICKFTLPVVNAEVTSNCLLLQSMQWIILCLPGHIGTIFLGQWFLRYGPETSSIIQEITAHSNSEVTSAEFNKLHKWLRCRLVWEVKVWQSLSCVWLFAIPWTVACQAPLSMQSSRQEYWRGLAILFSRGSPWPRDETQVSCVADGFFTSWATREAFWVKTSKE